jgi:hypothetical protein
MQKVRFFAISFLFLVIVSSALAQTGAKYLVITHDNFVNAIKPLVDWKTKKGVPAVCVPLSLTGNTSSQIKTYIQNAYNTWDPPPEYVLLVGSPDLLPSYYYAIGGYSDNYYADMTGNYEVELCLGRFHCATVAQCSLMVAKSIGYEKSETMHDSLWFGKGTTLIGEDYPPDQYYQPNCRYIRNLWLGAGYTHVDSFLSTNGDDATDVVNAINDGRAFVVYRGQSVSYWWPPFNVNPLNTTNGYKLPIVVSGSCATMTLTPGENMLADAFVRAGTLQNPKGSVGYFSTTFVGSHISQPRGLVTTGFFHALYEDSIFMMGGAAKRGKFIMDSILPNQTRYVEWNLLGDPELNVWTKQPQEIIVNHDSTIPLAPTNLQVEVEGSGQPVNHALVCVMMDSTVYTYDYTDSTGLVILSFTPQHTGTMQITVTAHNCFPYEGTLEVISRDIGVSQIVRPSGMIDSIGPITPLVRVRNYGASTETFEITLKIGTSYFQSRFKTISSVTEDTVNFPDWTPFQGTFTTRCSTFLVGDSNPINDTLDGSVTVGTKDIGVTQILFPSGTIDSSGPINPLVRVKNYGINTEFCFVLFKIGTAYAQGRFKTLDAGIEDTVNFPFWTPVRGTYVTSCSTNLTGDVNPNNDTLTGTCTIEVQDAGVTQIIAPTGAIDSGVVVEPQALVKNFGTNQVAFPVIFRIGTFYSDTQNVNLNSDDSVIVSFDSCALLLRGTQPVKCTTALTGDRNPTNNALRDSVTIVVHINDVGVTQIIAPTGNITPGTTVAPAARIVNFSLDAQAFPVFFRIVSPVDTVYEDDTMITLEAEQDSVIRFTDWNAIAGSYRALVRTSLVGDQNPENDTASNNFTVTSGGGGIDWQRMIDVPSAPSGKTPKNGSCMTALAGQVYLLKANNTSDFYSFTPNASIGTWSTLTAMPLGTKETGDGKNPKKGASMAAFDDKIYVLRGNNKPGFWRYTVTGAGWQKMMNIPTGAKNPKDGSGMVYIQKDSNDCIFTMKGSKTSEFYLYFINGDNWQLVASPSIGASGKAGYKNGSCLTYDGDSLVYVMKGNYGDFFRYNVLTNTWTELKRYDSKIFINREGKKKKVKDGAGLAYLNGAVYLMKSGKTNEFWKYDIGANNWLQMNPANLWDIPGDIKVKSGGALCLLDNSFYAVKGNKTSEFYRHGPPTSALTMGPATTNNEGAMEKCLKHISALPQAVSIVPNPAINVTTVKYTLPVSKPVSLRLYDVNGELIKFYTKSEMKRDGTITIDLKTMPAGVYILRFEAGYTTVTRKLVLEK